MNFGDVAAGTTLGQTGTLIAVGSDVTVSSANWKAERYTVSGITFPVTIPAGIKVPFVVTFAPQATGRHLGVVSFFSDALNSPITQTLSGNGIQVPHTVSLSWDPSDSPVVGYNIYRATQSGDHMPNSIRPRKLVQDSQTLWSRVVQLIFM